MKPQIVALRDSIEESANDLNQICCTMEILLEGMYEADEVHDSMREALALVWKNLLTVRDQIYGNCIAAESWEGVFAEHERANWIQKINDSGYGFWSGG